MTFHPAFVAHVDQLMEEVRERVPPSVLRNADTQEAFAAIIDWLNDPFDRIESRVRLLALSRYIRSIQETPPCSSPSSPDAPS